MPTERDVDYTIADEGGGVHSIAWSVKDPRTELELDSGTRNFASADSAHQGMRVAEQEATEAMDAELVVQDLPASYTLTIRPPEVVRGVTLYTTWTADVTMSGSGPYAVASSIKDHVPTEQGTTSHSHIAGTKQSVVNHIVRSAALTLMRASVTVADLGASGTITFVPTEPGPGLTLDPPYTIPWTRASGVISYDVDDDSGTIDSDSITFQTADEAGDSLNTLREIARGVVSASFTIADMSSDTLNVGVGDYGDDTLDPPYTNVFVISDQGGGTWRAAYTVKNGSSTSLDTGNLDYPAATEAKTVYAVLRQKVLDAVDAENAVSDLSASITTTLKSTDRVLDMGYDKYGGLNACPSPGGGTGHFRVEKRASDSRWLFVSPLGNYMWLKSSEGHCFDDYGSPYETNFISKYGHKDTFSAYQNRKLWWLGMNCISGYYALRSLPITTWDGLTGPCASQVPFMRLYNTQYHSFTDPTYPTKVINFGVDTDIHTTFPGGYFSDVFHETRIGQVLSWFYRDPSQQEYGDGVKSNQTVIASTPWFFSVMPDDGDFMNGFGPGPDGYASQGKMHPHLGWVGAVTAPTQESAIIGVERDYSWDNKCYTKYAFRDFLKSKYSDNLTSLNTAWESSYTTWDSDGGFPDGDGVLDEAGKSAGPIGTDFNELTSCNNQDVIDDLDDFLYEIAKQYFSMQRKWHDTYCPNTLLTGPDTMQCGTRTPILQAASEYLDYVTTSGSPYSGTNVVWQADYPTTGIPFVCWETFTSQSDSDLTDPPAGWGGYDFATQELRGEKYYDYIGDLFDLQQDGDYIIAGIMWWQWCGKTKSGENMNFGFQTKKDNLYDGSECTIAAGTDPWGYATGGESSDYGDFITKYKQRNQEIDQAIREGQ